VRRTPGWAVFAPAVIPCPFRFPVRAGVPAGSGYPSWLSQRRGLQMPNPWGISSPAHPLHPLFSPTSRRASHQQTTPAINSFLRGERHRRGSACPRAAIPWQASGSGGIQTSGLQLRGFFRPSSLICLLKCFEERKYSSCRIKKSLCHQVVYVASARGWFERSPRSPVMWKTSRLTSLFGRVAAVPSQEPAENERVGWRGLARDGEGLQQWRAARASQSRGSKRFMFSS